MRKTITKVLDCYHVDHAEAITIYKDNNLLPETVTVTVSKLASVFKDVTVMIFWSGGSKKADLAEGESFSAKVPAFGGEYEISAFATCKDGGQQSAYVTFEITDED